MWVVMNKILRFVEGVMKCVVIIIIIRCLYIVLFTMMCSVSLAGQTLIIGAKESGETRAKVVSHDGMLSCQSDSL